MRVGLERETVRSDAVVVSDVPGHGSWQARLHLSFERRGDKTILARAQHEGPLRVQRPFHPERNGTCHLYVLHPPGGVASGDELHIEAHVSRDAQALITTPGAGKLYKTRGPVARIEQRLQVAPGGCLEWLPQETIVFNGADARVQTAVELAEEARFAGWEIFCLGRPKSEERFERGALRTELTVSRAGELCFLERGLYRGGDALLAQPWGLSGAPVFGLFIVAAPNVEDSWVERVRTVVQCSAPDLFSVTLLPGMVLARYIGGSTLTARAMFESMFDVLRPLYAGAPAVPPRIWRT